MSDKRLITTSEMDETVPVTVDKQATEAKVRLLEAAEDHFGDHGFAGASLRSICQAAGVNLASVKYYFGDKEGLYIATVKHAHVCNASLEMAAEFPHDAPPREQLSAFIRIVAQRMHAPARPSAMKLMMREMADPGKAAHIIVQEFIQPMAFTLRGIIRQLMPGGDESKLLMIGFSVMGQILFYRQNRPISELIFGKADVEALTSAMVAEHVEKFTLAALGLGEPYKTGGGG